MKKENNTETPNTEEVVENTEEVTAEVETESTETPSEEKEGVDSLTPAMKKMVEKCEELQEKYLRLAAEYDNFRRRSAKEKENVYADAFAAAVSGILPIIDNVERAASFAKDDSEISKGILMLAKQCADALDKMGVKVMETDGAEFTPELHNAVMHEEDDSGRTNVISETFQKGYTYGDKVIRYAMVKVLN